MKNIILTENEFKSLVPYLNDTVNLEIKDYKSKKEILIEKSTGEKQIAVLKNGQIDIKKLTGLNSIVEYFARGKYGSNQYRGNCSGLLVKDLLEYFNPSYIIDPMCGGGTVSDIANNLAIPNLSLDLNPAFGGFDVSSSEMEISRSTPLIFWHPPYFVYEGSSMPVYSGNMWGKTANLHDGSHIHDIAKYLKWLNTCQANLYQVLRKDGIMAILIGDSRYKGQYFSPFKAMDIYGEIQNIIIKKQYNCVSDNKKYNGKFIPLCHEYLIIVKKKDEYAIKCLIVSHKELDIRKCKKITWRSLIQSTVEHLGGKATREQIYCELKGHPKAKDNNFLHEKIRQTINAFANEFIRNADGTVSLTV